jgi:hypothetical protein
MKFRNRFRNYVNYQALAAVLVFATFFLIAQKQIAALITSSIFFGVSAYILYAESKFEGYKKRISFIATLIFLVGFIVPIFLLRLSHWGTPFSEIVFLGISGQLLHQVSNYGFILMLVCYFIDSNLEQKRNN